MTNRNRRPLKWFTTSQDFTNLVSNAQTNLFLYGTSSSVAEGVKGSTITRMIVDLTCAPIAVSQRVQLFWGIAIINADARAAGAFPEADDPGDRADWLARGRLQSTSGNLSNRSEWDQVRLDLHSQRIMRGAEDELHLVLDAIGSGFTLDFSAYIRVLMKLP